MIAKAALFTLLVIATPTVYADFQAGVAAYRNHDYAAAFAEFKELAEAGNERAQSALALMYKFGEAVDKDMEMSIQWYKRAANSGYAPAQYDLAIMHLEGAGIERNRQAAIDWLRKAADAGYDRARIKLYELDQQHIPSEEESPQEPSIWSRAWNFRLPNDFRFGSEMHPQQNESYQVQLGAMSTREGANHLWEWLQLETGELFSGLGPRIKTAGGNSLYTVQAGPFANSEEARAFCAELVQQKSEAQCFPVTND